VTPRDREGKGSSRLKLIVKHFNLLSGSISAEPTNRYYGSDDFISFHLFVSAYKIVQE
jgi:hypothetical protein